MKKPPDKSELRLQLRAETDSFLAEGGEIVRVAQGESAFAPGERPPPSPLFTEPKSDRTPVDDVVAALNERREAKRNRGKPARPSKPTPRKQVIYDDFGEPMRVIWSEE